MQAAITPITNPFGLYVIRQRSLALRRRLAAMEIKFFILIP